jgi:cytochrome bd-type quinol oxidase subunit 1
MPPYYPVSDFGPMMKGMIIGSLGIVHVFLAMFAIGGGMLMCYFQWLAQTGRCANARKFVDGYFKILVLISFVVGAVTGVAMWFVSIQVSPRTIGMMVEEFHWVWAIEWTFFSLEITAGYCFYRFAPRLADRDRFFLLVLYSLASWFSLFWINGILTWQLTPGSWHETRNVWSGFFNPGFPPSLLFRTVTAMTIASLAACVVVNAMPELDREARTELINKAAHFLFPMALMPFLSAWYFGTMPEDSRRMVLGGSMVMTLFMGLATGASLLIGLYAGFGLLRRKLYINGATASLLVALSFAATAGGEFVREGVRKPYTVREALYSTSITPEEVDRLRKDGCVTNDPYPLRDADTYPNDQLRLGARVFRFHCSICHTIDGTNALRHLAADWTPTQRRMNIAQLQRTKTFMPPFSGTPEELEALVRLIEWDDAGRPREWPESTDAAGWQDQRRRIREWLDEVGTAPGYKRAKESR